MENRIRALDDVGLCLAREPANGVPSLRDYEPSAQISGLIGSPSLILRPTEEVKPPFVDTSTSVMHDKSMTIAQEKCE